MHCACGEDGSTCLVLGTSSGWICERCLAASLGISYSSVVALAWEAQAETVTTHPGPSPDGWGDPGTA